MRPSLAVVLSLFVVSCAPSPGADPVAADEVRQAASTTGVLSAPTLVGGQASTKLGTAVAACRKGGFIAGGPGGNLGVLWLPDGGGGEFVPTGLGLAQVGTSVACVADLDPVAMVAGAGGVWRVADAGRHA